MQLDHKPLGQGLVCSPYCLSSTGPRPEPLASSVTCKGFTHQMLSAADQPQVKKPKYILLPTWGGRKSGMQIMYNIQVRQSRNGFQVTYFDDSVRGGKMGLFSLLMVEMKQSSMQSAHLQNTHFFSSHSSQPLWCSMQATVLTTAGGQMRPVLFGELHTKVNMRQGRVPDCGKADERCSVQEEFVEPGQSGQASWRGWLMSWTQKYQQD